MQPKIPPGNGPVNYRALRRTGNLRKPSVVAVRFTLVAVVEAPASIVNSLTDRELLVYLAYRGFIPKALANDPSTAKLLSKYRRVPVV